MGGARERIYAIDPAIQMVGPDTTRIVGGCLHYDGEVLVQFRHIAEAMGNEFENYRFFVGIAEKENYVALMVDKPSIIHGKYARLTDTEYDMCKAVLSKVMSKELKVSPRQLEDNAAQIMADRKKRTR